MHFYKQKAPAAAFGAIHMAFFTIFTYMQNNLNIYSNFLLTYAYLRFIIGA